MVASFTTIVPHSNARTQAPLSGLPEGKGASR